LIKELTLGWVEYTKKDALCQEKKAPKYERLHGRRIGAGNCLDLILRALSGASAEQRTELRSDVGPQFFSIQDLSRYMGIRWSDP